MISAIILAAGQGQRMGPDRGKQLLPLGKSTILETTIDHIISSSVDATLVVLGHHSSEIAGRIASKPVKIVVNPDYLQGLSTSIIAGINAVDARSEAYLLALADQPFIPSQVIDLLLGAFKSSGGKIIIPTFNGRRGHPVILPAKYQAELLRLKGDSGARGIIANHAAGVLEVEVPSEWILLDIDTPKDYIEQQLPNYFYYRI